MPVPINEDGSPKNERVMELTEFNSGSSGEHENIRHSKKNKNKQKDLESTP